MKSPLFCLALSGSLAALTVAAPKTAPSKAPQSARPNVVQEDATEPPAQYLLQINGKPIPITLDKEISLDRKAGRTRFMISRAAARRFDKSGVKFDYPADYGFEADLSNPKIAIWTLNGRASLLMVQRFPLSGPAFLRDKTTNELVRQYGRQNVKIAPTAIFLSGRQIEGKRLRVSFAKQSLVQEIFAFSNLKYAFVLMIQDAPSGGKESAEARDLKAMLASSLSF